MKKNTTSKASENDFRAIHGIRCSFLFNDFANVDINGSEVLFEEVLDKWSLKVMPIY